MTDQAPASPESVPAAQPSADVVERLAALEHEQWVEWSQTVAREGLTPERIERWQRYWVAYHDLDEETKEHDRKWARLALAAAREAGPPAAATVVHDLEKQRALVPDDANPADAWMDGYASGHRKASEKRPPAAGEAGEGLRLLQAMIDWWDGGEGDGPAVLAATRAYLAAHPEPEGTR